jgi:predicted RNase H-like HicB family nuclease
MLATNPTSRLEAQAQYHFYAVTGRDADGYWAHCPELRGCRARGHTCEEALDNLQKAVALGVEDRLVCGEDIPSAETISMITVEVPARVLRLVAVFVNRKVDHLDHRVVDHPDHAFV